MQLPKIQDYEIERQNLLIAASVFLLALGSGFVLGEYFQDGGYEGPELYNERVNITLDSDNREETVEFDNRSVNLYFENWNEFRAYLVTQNGEKQINTTSDGERRTTSEMVIADNEAYRFYFRYKDDPEGFEGDFIQLYRIQQIQ
jgi:hypothetical protein